MSLFREWAQRRFSEDERFEEAFIRAYGPEMQYYYAPQKRISLTCQLLEAQAPEIGVWVDEAGTMVGCRQALGYLVQRHRKALNRGRSGRFRHRGNK